MASENQNLSTLANSSDLASAKGMKVAIVVAEWNKEITEALMKGAYSTLIGAGCDEKDIKVIWVPGAYELPYGSLLALRDESVDGVVALGCVVRGGTPHFEYVCSGATQGIMDVQLKCNRPIGFGLLTCDDNEQALDRAGGKLGNKGDEAAATLIEMISLQKFSK